MHKFVENIGDLFDHYVFVMLFLHLPPKQMVILNNVIKKKLVANPCDARDSFKSNVNMFKFKHFSNFNY